jgi:hypothetical protein
MTTHSPHLPPECDFRVCIETYAETSRQQILPAVWTYPDSSGECELNAEVEFFAILNRLGLRATG